jgi:hypothetical protein
MGTKKDNEKLLDLYEKENKELEKKLEKCEDDIALANKKYGGQRYLAKTIKESLQRTNLLLFIIIVCVAVLQFYYLTNESSVTIEVVALENDIVEMVDIMMTNCGSAFITTYKSDEYMVFASGKSWCDKFDSAVMTDLDYGYRCYIPVNDCLS